MTTRPSDSSSRRHPVDLARRDKPLLLGEREARGLRAGEPRRAAGVVPVDLLAFGEPLPSDYYLG